MTVKRLLLAVGLSLSLGACGGGPSTTADAGKPDAGRPLRCGDGYRDGPEACDDGNTEGGDGCAPDCTLEGVFTEVEPNDTVEQAGLSASVLTTHAVVVGRTTEGTDEVDIFRVTLAEAAVVRFEVFEGATPGDCPSMTSALRLYAETGAQLASDNVSGIGSCSALVFDLPPGTFYVSVEEAGLDGDLPQYALQLSLHVKSGPEVEPNEGEPTATVVSGTLNRVAAGDHSEVEDSDFFAVTVREGGSLRAEVIEGDRTAETCESLGVDSRLTLYRAGMVVLADDDDDGRGACSLIDGTGATPQDPGAHALAAGLYYLQVRASPYPATAARQFTYQLVLVVR